MLPQKYGFFRFPLMKDLLTQFSYSNALHSEIQSAYFFTLPILLIISTNFTIKFAKKKIIII